MSDMGSVRVAAASEAAALLFFAWAHADREGLALGVACLVGLGLLYRRRTSIAGLVLLGLLFVAVAFFTASAGVSNAANGEAGSTALLLSFAIIACVGLVALAVVAVRRPTLGQRFGWALATIAVVATLVSVWSAANAPVAADAAIPSALRVRTKDTAYSTRDLVARAGEIRVDMTNADLFWHTFTIDALGVDLRVPLDGSRSVTFTAAPGVYRYYCEVPGHAQAGMIGTLTVR